MKGGDIIFLFQNKSLINGKCSEKPRRRGPMTVNVDSYITKKGKKVSSHKRHKPK